MGSGEAVRFTAHDLEVLSALTAATWRDAADRDWTAPAGTLEWSCTRTAVHVVDTVVAPAFFLASRRQDVYPTGGWTSGSAPTPHQLADELDTATRVLTAVVACTSPDVRSIIWLRPSPEVRARDDFLPRAGVELALHGHDVAVGLGVPYEPPLEVCDRLRRHVADWPYWSSGPPWSTLAMVGDPWRDLLSSSGRPPR